MKFCPGRHNRGMQSERSHALYVVPDNVAWIDGTDIDTGEELYLTTVPDGQSVLLTGSAPSTAVTVRPRMVRSCSMDQLST